MPHLIMLFVFFAVGSRYGFNLRGFAPLREINWILRASAFYAVFVLSIFAGPN